MKLTELENKIRYISYLAKKGALTNVENKILDASGLVKKQAIIQKLLILKINLIL